MTTDAKLAQGIAELGLPVADDVQRKLLAYVALIEKWNRIHNLTALRDREEMVYGHLLDSLAVAPHVAAATILDVGSGAGLPGIPLALIWPDSKVALLDSNHKKAAFMRQAIIELAIDNATVVCERVERWQSTERFGLVISRAFSDLGEMLRLAGHLCAPEGTIAAMKGVYPTAELAEVGDRYRLREVLKLRVPGLRAERHLVLLSPER